MLDKNGFDKWASDYDSDVNASTKSDEYPFAAYDKLHERVCAMVDGARTLLDLGIGTGEQTKKYAQQGIAVTGVDFSPKMIELAKRNLPDAKFIESDFESLLDKLTDVFDVVTACYSIHHLDDDKKVRLLNGLKRVTPRVIIGDVCFFSDADRAAARERSASWDDAEYYCVFDTLAPKLNFAHKRFIKMSFCSGIIELTD